MGKRKIFHIFILLFFGAIVGSWLGVAIGTLLADGVVKDFFLKSASFGWGATNGNWVDLNVLRFKSGLFFEINFVGILGIGISWYFLRYFK